MQTILDSISEVKIAVHHALPALAQFDQQKNRKVSKKDTEDYVSFSYSMSPGDIVIKFSGIVTFHEESNVRREMSSEGSSSSLEFLFSLVF